MKCSKARGVAESTLADNRRFWRRSEKGDERLNLSEEEKPRIRTI
jgi:hypothetical protein